VRALDYFKAPTFEDADKTEQARVLFDGVVLLTLGVLVLAAVQIGVTGDWSHLNLRTVPGVVTLPPLALVCLELNRRGLYRAAGWLFIGGYLLLACLRAPHAHGVRAAPIAVFPIMTMFAGMLLGRAAGAVAAVAFVLAAGGLVLVEQAGLAKAGALDDPLVHWAALSLQVVLSLFLLLIAVGRTRDALHEARDSESNLNAIFRHTATGIALVDREGRLVTCNPAMQTILGYSEAELRTMSFADLTHADDVTTDVELYDELRAGRRDTYQQAKRYITKSGRTIWCDLAVSAVRDAEGGLEHSVAMVTDTTDRKQAEAARLSLEAQLRASEQMRGLGRMIAHDFNNLLGAIMQFSHLLEEDLPDSSPERQFAGRITDAAERGRTIVEQILSFARQGAQQREVIDLGGFVAEAEPLLRGIIAANAVLQVERQDPGLNALVNAGQMTQAISNLCKNASDALRGRPGRVSVEVRRLDAAAAADLLRPTARDTVRVVGQLAAANAYASIKVSDDGAGIAPAKLDRIFDPFFTTKDRQGGTGLGLAVVQAATDAHGGACLVESVVGQGSTFQLLIPLHRAEAPPSAIAEGPIPQLGRILVVDDERDITDVLVAGLKRRGYEAVGFNDPNAALEAFRRDPQAWRLVITDQMMPQLRGSDLATAAKALRPDVLAVLYSGETGEADDGPFDLRLAKPLDVNEIASRIYLLCANAPVQDRA
jgi:PAS domain S-box-containing protein